MIILIETPAGSIRSLLPDGLDAQHWHGPLAGEIAEHLSLAHAAVLAVPVPGPGGTVWQAPATAARRLASLPPADQASLLRALGAILSDIRRLAESGAAPSVTRCWPMLREIPDLGMVHAADGRPVLAGWGAVPDHAHAPRGLLAVHDDGQPWRPAPRTPWRAYGVAAAALAGFALAAGLLLPLLGWPTVTVAACTPDPGGMAALSAQARADGRHNDLLAELARLVGEQGRRRLQCAIPGVAPALPRDRWESHDLGILAGCWSRVSNMSVKEQPTGRVRSVTAWELCFDGQGGGRQTITLTDGSNCTGPLAARFESDKVMIHADRCVGDGLRFVQTDHSCSRASDVEATCLGRELEGTNQSAVIESRFHR